jgi:organic radical activating enzyme
MSGLKGSMVKPCCSFADGKDVNWDNTKLQNINSFNEVLNTNQWKNLRDKISPDNCIRCIESEKQTNFKISSAHSLRTYWNEIIKDNEVQLELMHISVDSLCNMSCLSCSPTQSSSWNKKKNIKELAENGFNFKYNNELTSYVENFKRVAENTDYSKLKVLKISGGEPFYSDNVYWFIKHLESKVDLNNIDLWINTNASIIPKDNMWQLIQKFKTIHIDMSIDAVGEYHEYVRYGSKWSDVLSFIEFIKNNKSNNMYLCAHSVYSILNFNVYNKILDFFVENNIEFTYTILQYPKYLSILNLPITFRNFYKLEKKNKELYYFTNQISTWSPKKVIEIKINQTLQSSIKYENNGTLKKYLEIMEKENNNKLEDYNPELKKIIEEYNL